MTAIHKKDKKKAAKLEKFISGVNDYFFDMSGPKDFTNSENNIIAKMLVADEQLFASLEDAGVNDPGSMTVFEILSRIQYYEKKHASLNKAKTN